MNENSKLLSTSLGILYPVILLFGFYIIMNGHKSPGGGFQGGAILMAVFICKYLINQQDALSLVKLYAFEKLVFLFILIVALGFLATFVNLTFPFFNSTYLILMNALIGLKVACGMTIIFYRFIRYEVR